MDLAPAIHQFWDRICEVCDLCSCALLAALEHESRELPADGMKYLCSFWGTRVRGSLVAAVGTFNPYSGAVCWAWSLSWRRANQALLSMSGIVK